VRWIPFRGTAVAPAGPGNQRLLLSSARGLPCGRQGLGGDRAAVGRGLRRCACCSAGGSVRSTARAVRARLLSSSVFYAPRCASLREPHACTFPCSTRTTTRLDARALDVVNCDSFCTGTVTWTCLLFPCKRRERTPRTTIQEAYRLKWANI
jgi:hypothetical protein